VSINKSFVIKNGLEVNSNLILADADTNRVGIGTSIPEYTLNVYGGIGATDARVTGVATVLNQLQVGTGGTVLTALGLSNLVGVGTAIPAYLLDIRSPVSTGQTALYVQGDVIITGDLSVDDIFFDDATLSNLEVTEALYVSNSGLSTFTGYVDINSSVDISTDLNVSGLSTLGGYVDINSSADISGDLNVAGVVTSGSLSIGSTQVLSSGFELQNIASLDATTTATIEAAIANGPNTFTDLTVSGVSTFVGLSTFGDGIIVTSGISTLGITTATDLTAESVNVSGIGTIAIFESSDGTITNLSGTIGTIGSVQIASGIITSASGVVTYYGDGQYLDLTNNPSTGIGIGTESGVVGYGITFIDFYGAGVSTSLYDSSVGIATIYFEGGGGGSASIGIGSTPGDAFVGVITSGNLWYNTNLGRLFIYYQDTDSAQWVDAAPFNIGIITSLTGGVSFSDGTAASPSWYFTDDQTTGVFSPTNGELTFVSVGSSILNINSGGIDVTGVITATSFVGDLTGNATSATYAANSGVATYATSAGIATDLLGGNAGVNTTSTPTNLYVSGNAASNIVGLGTTNANTALNFGIGNNFSLTLTGSIILSNPTGLTTGQSGIVLIQQDGVGSHVVGFGSHWDFPSSTPPTLSTGANALDALTYFVRSSTSIITNSLIGIGTL